MAILTKAQLEALNQSSFADNTTGAITPEVLREYNTATIDTLVDSLDTGSYATSAITGSSLITASFDNGTRNLTFTKGDSTTFNVNIPDVSGSSGNFATTGSNNFIGDQTITGSLIVSGSTIHIGTTVMSGSISVSGSQLFRGTQTTSGSQLITGSSTQIGNNTLSGINTITGSNELLGTNRIVGNSELTGSFLITGSIAMVQDSIFTSHIVKAAGSNGLELRANNNSTIASMGEGGGTQARFYGSLSANSVSASTINGLGDPLAFSSSVDSRINALTGSAPVGYATTGSNSFIGDQTITGSVNLSGGEHLFIKRSTIGADNILRLGVDNNGNNFEFLVTGSENNPGQKVWGINVAGNVWGNSFDAGVVFNSYVTASNGIRIQDGGTFSAPLTQGNVWVGDANGRTSLVPTSSFAGGGTINTGSFATTGSNIFDGGQTITNGGIDLQSNPQGSGSAYVSVTGRVDTTSDPTNVYSALQLVKPGSGDNLIGLAVNSYSAQYGTATPMILADGNNPDGNNTAIGFPSNGQMDVWKKSNFKYGVSVTGSTELQSFTASLQQGYAYVGGANGKTTTVPTSSFAGGGTINTGSFITTGSSTANQAISGALSLNTTFTTNLPLQAQDNGTNVVPISYGDVFGTYGTEFGYWLGTNFSGVTVSGTGIVNGTITGTNFGSNFEVNIVNGTITNGSTYTFTGPALQTLSVTGSVVANSRIAISAANGNTVQMTQDGINVSNTNSQQFVGTPGAFQLIDNNNGNRVLTFAATSSVMFNGGGTWQGGPQIAVYDDSVGDVSVIGFQTNENYTDGRVTILTPLVTQQGLIVTGSLTASGSVTSNGLLTANSAIQVLNGGGIDLKANTQGSGSSFTSISSIIDTTSDPGNVYSAFQMIKPNGDALLNMAVNSYSPQYSTALPMILADGNNPGGNNTAIIWTSNGQAEHWKKSNFKYGADVTGSVKVTQVMNLKPQNPLPSGTIGDLAVSGSNLYFYNGAWTQVI